MLPILYSFRRCPYAMRARMALAVSNLTLELREVLLRDKPAALLAASPKATVPVLVLGDGEVIDESLDIMRWALAQSDPHAWRQPQQGSQTDMDALVAANDQDFKHHLDRTKYANRYEGADAMEHRTEAERFLSQLEARLQVHPFLFGEGPCFADVAIAPFVRQFANIDEAWFARTPYRRVQVWLEHFVKSPLFQSVMLKSPPWKEGDPLTVFPGLSPSSEAR